MSLIAFGWLAIGSLFMLVSWGYVAIQFWRDPAEHNVWSRRLWISTSLTLHAAVMLISTVYRLVDLWNDPHALDGPSQALFLGILLSLAASKGGLVWAGSIDPEKHRVRWPWWAYLFSLLVWWGIAR